MEYDEVQDSGKREDFTTGSRRDTREGKGRFDLIPAYPLLRLAKHYENGAVKYGDHNWTKGQPISRYLDSALRHLFKWMMGYRNEDHLIAAVWNILSIVDHEERIKLGYLPKELDDMEEMPKYTPKQPEDTYSYVQWDGMKFGTDATEDERIKWV